MNGSSYGDFSRSSYDPSKQYRAVLMQQGRVQLDADWNEQARLTGDQLATAIAELVGGSAAPAADPGYAVTPLIGLDFSPGGFAQATDSGPFQFSGEDAFTLELWARLAGRPGTLLECVGWAGDPPPGYWLGVDGDLSLSFQLVCSDGGPAHLLMEINSGEALPMGRFVHVAVVCDGSTVQLYVDGVLLESEPLPGMPLAAGGPFVIGGAAPGYAAAPGQFAGVRVWSSARTSADVAAASLAGPRGRVSHLPDDLLAWWPLDDGRGSSAAELVAGNVAELGGLPAPAWGVSDLEIGSGAYYVEGIRAFLPEPVRYTAQPARPGAVLPTEPGRYLVYLDVWERSVSVVEDPELREPALGSIDTTVRSQVVAAVHHVVLPDDAGGDPDRALDASLHAAGAITTGRMAARAGAYSPANRLYRVEIHRGGTTDDPAAELEEIAVALDAAAMELRVWASELQGIEAGHEIELTGVDRDGRRVSGRHVVHSVHRGPDGIRLRLATDLEVWAGFTDCRLRRPPRRPSFKWSGSNGSVVLAVAPVEPGSRDLRLLAIGPDPTPLKPGDAVELVDDIVTLGDRPGDILTVDDVAYDSWTLRLDRAPSHGLGADPAHHPFLRRWDQVPAGEGTTGGAVALEPERWIELEDGIEVWFEPGSYRRGDFWWVVARQEFGIMWPEEDGHPAILPPTGIEHRRAALALLTLGPDGVEVRDLRRWFAPMAAASGRPELASTAEPGVEHRSRKTAWRLRRHEEGE